MVCGEFGSIRESAGHQQLDRGRAGKVGGVLVVLTDFGGGDEPAVDHGPPEAGGGTLQLEYALLPPLRRHFRRREAVDAGAHLTLGERIDGVVGTGTDRSKRVVKNAIETRDRATIHFLLTAMPLCIRTTAVSSP